MENKEPGSASHEDMDDQPTKTTSEPQTTTDEPPLNEKRLADKYVSDTQNERG